MLLPHILAAQPHATAIPFWQTLAVGAAAGAAISALVTLLSGFLEAGRAHRRWLREKRLDAYVQAFALTKGFDLNSKKTDKVVATLLEDFLKAHPNPDASEAKMTFDKIVEHSDYRTLEDQASAIHASAARELAAVIILGPDDVSVAIVGMQKAYEVPDDDTAGNAEVAFLRAARRALKVRRWSR